MRLLFISFWSANEPLTSSTILPYLRIMVADPSMEKVVFASVERGEPTTLAGLGELRKVVHHPIVTRYRAIDQLSKLDQFTGRINELVRLVKDHRIDMIDAKGSLAGGMAHLVSQRTGVPYVVESFEPHSDYMADCGVWGRRGISYRVARWLERKQKDHARAIVTVTENYRAQLMDEGVPADRIKVIPSITDIGRFAFSAEKRDLLRAELGWQDSLVGIYVGKFGGLYYEGEAFDLFERVRQLVGPQFRLIIITVVPEQQVRNWLGAAGFPQEHAVVRAVDHGEVPHWLSAADIAFSLHRITPSSLYFGPVKNGEYWANGLPILLPHGVSDDFRIVQEKPWTGAIFDPGKPEKLDQAVDHLKALVATPGHRERIMQMCREIRDIRVARLVYKEMFGFAVD